MHGKRVRCYAKSMVNGEKWGKRGKHWWRVVEPSTLFVFFLSFLLNCMIARQLPTIDALLMVKVPDVTQNRREQGKKYGKRGKHWWRVVEPSTLFVFFLFFSFKLHDSETITHNRCIFTRKRARCHAKSMWTEEKIREKRKALVEGSWAIYSFCFFSLFFLLNCMIARQLPTLLMVNVPGVTRNRREQGKNYGKKGKHWWRVVEPSTLLFYPFFSSDFFFENCMIAR